MEVSKLHYVVRIHHAEIAKPYDSTAFMPIVLGEFMRLKYAYRHDLDTADRPRHGPRSALIALESSYREAGEGPTNNWPGGHAQRETRG